MLKHYCCRRTTEDIAQAIWRRQYGHHWAASQTVNLLGFLLRARRGLYEAPSLRAGEDSRPTAQEDITAAARGRGQQGPRRRTRSRELDPKSSDCAQLPRESAGSHYADRHLGQVKKKRIGIGPGTRLRARRFFYNPRRIFAPTKCTQKEDGRLVQRKRQENGQPPLCYGNRIQG